MASTAALLSIGSLHASVQRVTNVSIPFEFQASGARLPAGDYCIEQEACTEIATIINVKSGQRVRILSPNSLRNDGRGSMQFVPAGATFKLKIN
jgi:hypothetical protein